MNKQTPTTEANLLRENAELAASNVRLREALESAKLCHNPNGSYCWCHPSNEEGRHEQHCMWIRDRADKTPAQSLEAIRAEERNRCIGIIRETLMPMTDSIIEELIHGSGNNGA